MTDDDVPAVPGAKRPRARAASSKSTTMSASTRTKQSHKPRTRTSAAAQDDKSTSDSYDSNDPPFPAVLPRKSTSASRAPPASKATTGGLSVSAVHLKTRGQTHKSRAKTARPPASSDGDDVIRSARLPPMSPSASRVPSVGNSILPWASRARSTSGTSQARLTLAPSATQVRSTSLEGRAPSASQVSMFCHQERPFLSHIVVSSSRSTSAFTTRGRTRGSKPKLETSCSLGGSSRHRNSY